MERSFCVDKEGGVATVISQVHAVHTNGLATRGTKKEVEVIRLLNLTVPECL